MRAWTAGLIVGTLAALLTASAPDATGQTLTNCSTRDTIVKVLKDKHSEGLKAYGMTASGQQVLEIFTTENGGTWTAVVTSPQGMSCAVASGEGWTTASTAQGQPI